ncbi:MAG: sigma-54 dependent transcriptional regulator [Maribacter dokdonensis]|uniref:DNA-binding transcriptional response regulator, NtrC family, contains REC, AAA-type ATPase, and a Fis-type DNA-binding domains n=3 Tax=Maribacter dokdonensis TaxID=320912 RepID=A0A1H4K592_9FLAO|nr:MULTISPECIES: sigma-54 dependent transcriptional regulator [Maribacter]KSA13243.1 Two-component system response regulator [Maribacter dokdonensis DSW-8]MBU2900985.1 sigma-54 dependent transcriptional regulator [Maribacter dokdonensis]MDP2526187.1 sigma-54 dependent transcriptional regulator [Maribacter dokdonensis]PHN95331.1 sigma-54-dependent Fis family transcriptional regulator [Maribacter sp. 6B07]CAG2534229.1 AAA-type ATPase [Maribacter dokdonensis]|tara:strand:+ start:19366 stop:20730 length:1365 start_codon:yes stop_codon:yes gene_type:complete
MIDAKILVIDDTKSVLSALEILLQFEYKSVQTISNPNLLSSFPNLKEIDIILLDMNFSAGVNTGNEGLYWLREIKKKAPHISVIMMTAYGAVELAVEAIKEGATDFVLKPWNNERLLTTVKSAYELRKSQKEVQHLKQKESNLKQVINQNSNYIIGNSKALNSVLSLVQKVAKTDVNILVTGENGTGKELIARELHKSSARNNEVFISVDMGSISENLFESELFGHVKGSFTDAKDDRAGKFEAANGGTLFLDEIGNLSLQMQAKLLSVIQNRVVVRVGSNKPIPVDIRLVCATNCNLEQMVADGLFREDLLYRINTIQVQVPALRDRDNDVLVLADYFLKKYAHKYGKPSLKINQTAQEKLITYPWPGNVRELLHTMERAVILSEGNVLKPTDFLLDAKPAVAMEAGPKTLEEMELLMITKALNDNDGNYSAAADQLGISRQTLYNKLKKSGK